MTVRYLSPREAAFRDAVKRAVDSALAGGWKDAALANREALALAPRDIESHNRLAKALSELGRIAEAIKVYETSARLDPRNTIAKRNIERLSSIATSALAGKTAAAKGGGTNGTAEPAPRTKLNLFITDRSRSTVARLDNVSPPSVLAVVGPGDPLELVVHGDGIAVAASGGDRLGTLGVRLGSRLARLISGGNRYEAFVASMAVDGMSVLVREVHRAPQLARQASFPVSSREGVSAESDADDFAAVTDDWGRFRTADDEEESEAESSTARSQALDALLSGSPRGGDGELAV